MKSHNLATIHEWPQTINCCIFFYTVTKQNVKNLLVLSAGLKKNAQRILKQIENI